MMLKRFFMEEDAVGTVEIILILVVLIALVAIFKTQALALVRNLMTKVTNNARAI